MNIRKNCFNSRVSNVGGGMAPVWQRKCYSIGGRCYEGRFEQVQRDFICPRFAHPLPQFHSKIGCVIAWSLGLMGLWMLLVPLACMLRMRDRSFCFPPLVHLYLPEICLLDLCFMVLVVSDLKMYWFSLWMIWSPFSRKKERVLLILKEFCVYKWWEL